MVRLQFAGLWPLGVNVELSLESPSAHSLWVGTHYETARKTSSAAN